MIHLFDRLPSVLPVSVPLICVLIINKNTAKPGAVWTEHRTQAASLSVEPRK